jgi:hypothetical protein
VVNVRKARGTIRNCLLNWRIVFAALPDCPTNFSLLCTRIHTPDIFSAPVLATTTN